MIAKITLENFFSFRSPAIIELNRDLNILIGINASGKSNFLKAFLLLKESIVGHGLEKLFLGDWGGFDAVRNFSRDQREYIRLTFEFDKDAIQALMKKQGYQGFKFPGNPVYELKIFHSGLTSYFLEEKLYSVSVKTDEPDFIYMETRQGKGIISTRDRGVVGIQRYPQDNADAGFRTTEPVLRQISDPDRFYPMFTLKRALESICIYHTFDTSTSSPIRQPAGYDTETRLFSNGQNLALILNRLKNKHTHFYEKVEQAVRKINPFFKDINFDIIGSKIFLVLREAHLTKSVSIEHISDGTLRYMLLMSILFNPEHGGTVCIDEPDAGLHPDMIATIAESIKTASRSTQMVVATHSPLLLNSYDPDDILIFEKNAANETIVLKKSPEDMAPWETNFLAGQAWLQGLMGGKRW